MTGSTISRAWIRGVSFVVVLGLGWLPETALEAQELSAVITQLKPTVTRRLANAEAPRAVYELDVLGRGEELIVNKGGQVGLACSSERWIELIGPTRWTLQPEACARGRELPPGTFRSMAPQGGRLRMVGGILALESNVRGPGLSRILLSPRQTMVRQARPEILWVKSEEAVEYLITLSNRDSPIRLDAKSARCGADKAWQGLEVCSHPWPTPGLRPGQTLYLDLGYRTSRTAPFEQDEGTGAGRWVTRLDEPSEQELTRQLQALASLSSSWSERSRTLAEAGVYVRFELFSDAIEAFQPMYLGDPAHEVTLADLYFKVDLMFASKHYRSVLSTGKESADLAAAHFGMGRLFYGIAKLPQARDHFLKAEGLYLQAGFPDLAATAAAWAAGTPPDGRPTGQH